MDDEKRLEQFQKLAVGLLNIIRAQIDLIVDLSLDHDLLKKVVLSEPHTEQVWRQMAADVRQAPAQVPALLKISEGIETLLQAIADGSWETADPEELLKNKRPN